MLRVPLALALLLAAAPAWAADSDSRPAFPPAAYAPFTDGQPEKGGLKSHEAVITQRDVIVYRLYDSRAPGNTSVARRMGVFWTDFTGSSETQARDQLAVCKGWNDMAAKVVRSALPKDFISNPSVLLTSCSDASTGW